jgi:hypothetical protein
MRTSWWMGIVGLIAAGVAWAAIPAADGTITACYNAKSGKLRVVDGTPCKKKEKALTWNQAGQTGPTGEPGAPGAPGADTRIFAFVQTWQCCGDDGELLDPPVLRNASGITAATRESVGQYTVTVNRDVNDCVATATLASFDAAWPQAGVIGVGRPSGIPDDEFLIVTRDTNGTLADIGSTGGTYGISIAVFCPS